ncbi:hypothetical protein H0H93_005014, partial [Arthromyces matolae]
HRNPRIQPTRQINSTTRKRHRRIQFLNSSFRSSIPLCRLLRRRPHFDLRTTTTPPLTHLNLLQIQNRQLKHRNTPKPARHLHFLLQRTSTLQTLPCTFEIPYRPL